MAIARCPQCQLPMTAEEARAAACPACAAPLAPADAAAAKPPAPDPGRAASHSWPLVLLAAVALLVVFAGGIFLGTLFPREPDPAPPAPDTRHASHKPRTV